MGFIRRSPQPGSRALYFRLDEDAWRQAMRKRMVNVQRLRELAERGLDAGELEYKGRRDSESRQIDYSLAAIQAAMAVSN